jgi:hypothetical protein
VGELKGTLVKVQRDHIYHGGRNQPFYRHQFPLCLAFAMTAHKAQGHYFELAGLDLEPARPRHTLVASFIPNPSISRNFYQQGHLYTAVSRVLKLTDLRVVKQLTKTVRILNHAQKPPEVFKEIEAKMKGLLIN